MKKKLGIILFIISSLLFAVLIAIFVDFGITAVRFGQGDFLEALIIVLAYCFSALAVCVLGLGFSVPSAILAHKKWIRLCAKIETVIFSLTAIISAVRLFVIE